ncbi:calcineurin-like phosphoesterase family protein [Pseudonocardia nematodicida]|uniref:Calcineurin-like phosphoesterase family protein n=1 Tax=Pseudonocardia nematodicida TaxID=1206997 RepID=A0ABV1KIV2_9PSEU
MRHRTTVRLLGPVALGVLLVAAVAAGTSAARDDQAVVDDSYIASIEVVPGDGAPRDTVTGVVFDDVNRDGVHDDGEAGVPGVTVSNGREVVRTDDDGRYTLPVRDDMTVFVTKPNDRAVPLDENLVPQFAYAHKPAGSPEEFRFGGLPPTGPLPAAINFPTVSAPVTDQFRCLAMGDTQTYSNTEVGYIRDSIATDMARRGTDDMACMLLLGDAIGDDLGLLPRFMEMMSSIGLPQYYAHGNHDFDIDAPSNADKADSWRNLYGPTYYSFDVGRVHFVTLDNVVYPCTPAENPDGTRPHCDDPEGAPAYTGAIGEQQLAWLEADLATVPEDTLIVLSHHIPLLSTLDGNSATHQTADVARLYEIVGDRPALSLSGHTHSIENLLPGDRLGSWPDTVGVETPAFPHLIAGAPSGLWFEGDLDVDGIPMALAQFGEPRGYYVLDFDGPEVTETYYASGHRTDRQMWLSFDTPAYRDWYTALTDFHAGDAGNGAVPPVNVNDLGDTKLFTPAELREGVSLSANVWNGSTASTVTATLGDADPVPMEHTQPLQGEQLERGVEFSDPFSVVRQLQITRFGQRSTSGDERAQGYESLRGAQFGPGPPGAVKQDAVANRNQHLWRLPLPTDLEVGTHVATVTHTDRHGRTGTEEIVFEVRDERPDPLWRDEPWN